MPVGATGKQGIVSRFRVTDVRANRQVDRSAVEALGRGTSANPLAVFPAGMLRDASLSPFGTPGIASPHFRGESLQVLLFGSEISLRTPASLRGAGGGVIEARQLRRLQSVFLDQQTLAFVAPTRSAPLQHHRPEGRSLLRAPGQRGIARRQELEVVEIRAGQTQGTLRLDQADPGRPPQLGTALPTRALPARDEDLDFRSPRHEAICSMGAGGRRPS